MSREHSLAGYLLVADPTMRDPNFERAVILMLDHDDEGAVGVVLTRPSEVLVDSVLPGWGDYVEAPARVFVGGPVSPESAIAVGVLRPGVLAEGFTPAAGVACIVDLDTVPRVAQESLDGVRIFAGYAGWASGQLEDEIVEGAWLVCDVEPSDVAGPDPDHLWEAVLKRQGGWLAVAASFPDDPSAN